MFVVVSDAPIGSPIVAHPQVAVVFNNPSYDKYEPLVAEGGLLVVNQSLVEHTSNRRDIDVLYVPANEIAEDIGSTRLTNMVLVGAMLQMRPVITLDDLIHGLEAHIPEQHRDMLALNIKAVQQGAEFVVR